MHIKTAGIIPARFQSTRFPGKLLERINGRTIINHVWQRAMETSRLSKVIIATDDMRIKSEADSFGADVVMTSPDHKSGTDRVAEASTMIDADIIVNIQGDEPMIRPEVIDCAVEPMISDPTLSVSTICSEIKDEDELNNPNVVKVVTDKNGMALYFSRFPIPFIRDTIGSVVICRFKHIGLYVYRKKFLQIFSKLIPSPLEEAEKLEQLRVLENGYKIKVVKTQYDSFGIDTPEDLTNIKKIFKG